MAEHKAGRTGQQLGPYRLIRLLGAGGFGEVYEADHRLLQQKRAVKLLLERHFHNPKQRERFLREARILAALEHPNILPVLEVGEEDTILYLVMPFYHRGTLNNLLKQRTTMLPLAEVERILAQMCAAVGYAHTRNIAHLDLKPDNILLHDDGRLVLSDFGLAHLIKQGRLEAGNSASWGTPYYMAPEQIRGEPELRSDLYALGVILYQLLTNQRPFTADTPEAVMIKHLLEAPPSLHAASPRAPATLEPVMRKALGKKPEERYATAEALLADFCAAVSSPSPRPALNVSHSVLTPPINSPVPKIPVSPEHVLAEAENAKQRKKMALEPTVSAPSLDVESVAIAPARTNAIFPSPTLVTGMPIISPPARKDLRSLIRKISAWRQPLVSLEPVDNWLQSLAFSPDSEYIASTGSEGKSYIFEIATKKRIVTFTHDVSTWANAVAWSPNGKYIALGGDKGKVDIWNTERWNQERTLNHKGRVASLFWSQNSAFLSVSMDSIHNQITVWDIFGGRPISTYDDFGGSGSVDWSPDGIHIATLYGHKFRMFDTSQAKFIMEFMVDKLRAPCSIAISPNNKYVALGDNNYCIYVWDINTTELIYTFTPQGNHMVTHSLAWSPDGKYLAAGRDGSTVFVLSVTKKYPVLQKNLPGGPYIRSVAWSPKKKKLAVTGGQIIHILSL
jgi:serine/threonine protein kinase